MIKVIRGPKPSILSRNEVIWKREISNASSAYLLSKSKLNKEKLERAIKRYGHPQIKSALIEMFHGKCAYCESKILHVDYGDIEHFRPKSKFPDKAIDWDNLYLSCKRCNGKGQKGDSWFTEVEGGPLVDPCQENPEEFFRFYFDEATMVSLVIPKNERAELSVSIFGLNRHDLLEERNYYVRSLIVLAKLADQNKEAKDLLDQAVLDSQKYSAFAKSIKQKYV